MNKAMENQKKQVGVGTLEKQSIYMKWPVCWAKKN